MGCACEKQDNTQHKEERQNFYMETLNREKPLGGEEYTIIRQLQELQELFVSLSVGLHWKKGGSKSLPKKVSPVG